jgi:hypothetical protein
MRKSANSYKAVSIADIESPQCPDPVAVRAPCFAKTTLNAALRGVDFGTTPPIGLELQGSLDVNLDALLQALCYTFFDGVFALEIQ